MTEQVEQRVCIKFCVKLEHSSTETIHSGGCSHGQLIIVSFITTMCLLMHHVSCRAFLCNIKSWGDSAPLQPRFGALWLLAFVIIKSPLKWKRFQTIDEIQENMTGSWCWLGELCEIPRCLLWSGLRCHVPCTMFVVSCIFFNKPVFFIEYGCILSGQTHLYGGRNKATTLLQCSLYRQFLKRQ